MVIVWAVATLCVVVALALFFNPPKGNSRQIAEALLHYHNQCATNGYDCWSTDLPAVLKGRYGDDNPGRDFQPHRACVQYTYRRFGIDCDRTFDLSATCWFTRRAKDTNSWTLICVTSVVNPLTRNCISWEEQLVTITNLP